jgi:hypothetical protein
VVYCSSCNQTGHQKNTHRDCPLYSRAVTGPVVLATVSTGLETGAVAGPVTLVIFVGLDIGNYKKSLINQVGF